MYKNPSINDEIVKQAMEMKESGASLLSVCKELGVSYNAVYSKAKRLGYIEPKGTIVCLSCGKRTEDKKANYCSCCGKKIPTEKDDAEVALQTIRKMVSELPGHYRDSAARAIAELDKYIKNH